MTISRVHSRGLARAIACLAMLASGTGFLPLAAARDAASMQTPPASTTGASQRATLAITGGRLIDGFGGVPLDNAVVIVQGDRIAAIGQAGVLAVPAGAKVIDANGMTVMPGLWESHGHLNHVGEGDPTLFTQAAFRARLPEVMASVARLSLLSGITSFRDTGGPLAEQQALRREIEASRAPGPRLFLAGPIVYQRAAAAGSRDELSVTTADEARAAAERLVALKVDQIKVYGFWDEPVLSEIVKTAHAAGVGVDADVRHIVAYRTAVRAGVDRLHHVFTADPLSDYAEDDLRLLVRGERPVGAGPSGNIVRGPYIVPTIEMRRSYVRAHQFPEVVDHPRLRELVPADVFDALRRTWQNPAAIPWGIGAGERVKVALAKLRRFIDAGGREQIVAGCDAGSPLNFHSPLARELANLVDAGLRPMEAIQAATLRPAEMQGVSKDLGTLSVGKLADLLVVDGDPLQQIDVLQHRVVHVIKGGQVYK